MTTPTHEIVIEDLKFEIEDARRNDVLYRLTFSWEVVQALIANVERLEAELAATRRAALLDAAKSCCYNCRTGVYKLKLSDDLLFHVQADGKRIARCDAWPIHALLAQEQERAQGEGGGDGE